MFRLYWLVVSALAALAVHAGYVLYVPGRDFQDKVSAITGSAAPNRFVILKPEQAQRLLPVSAPNDVVGLCRYDTTLGPVVFESKLPKGFWTFAVYTNSGKQAYTLTDAQAGETAFTVELTLVPDIIKQLTGAFDDAAGDVDVISNAGWRVNVPEPKGLAVIWLPLADAVFRTQAEAVLAETVCKRK
jgi:uncharacterized membrane protein